MELEHARIAKRIQQARKQAGLTQQQTADLLGVIQRTYQNYESQSTPRIPWDRLNDIARITSVKVEWLLHGDSPDLMGALNGGGLSADASERLDRIEEMLQELLRRTAPSEPAQPETEPGGDDVIPRDLPGGPDSPQAPPSEDEDASEAAS